MSVLCAGPVRYTDPKNCEYGLVVCYFPNGVFYEQKFLILVSPTDQFLNG